MKNRLRRRWKGSSLMKICDGGMMESVVQMWGDVAGKLQSVEAANQSLLEDRPHGRLSAEHLEFGHDSV